MCNVVGGWYRIWLEVATHQFIGLAKKAFQMQGLCILAHNIDLKGDYIIYRSRCHGNVRINDSKSHRIIPIAWRVTINPKYVRCGQSARDDKSHIRCHHSHYYA